MRIGVIALTLLALGPVKAAAEWQIKPFLGVTFGGNTTFVDVEDGVDNPHISFGVSTLLVGEIFGLEADFGQAPGFFQAGEGRLVKQSNVTTLSGSFVVALPRRLAEYGLRPYFVGGAGMMRVRSDHQLGVLQVASTLPALHIGGGVTGFLTDRFGLNWDVRRFHSTGGTAGGRGVSFGREQLSFWRAQMALAIRY